MSEATAAEFREKMRYKITILALQLQFSYVESFKIDGFEGKDNE